jgi:hypothetical protein
MATNAKLDALRKKRQQIAAQIAEVEAKEKAKARKEDTRLKVLIGAAIIADVGLYPETRAGVEAVLKRAITADRDVEFLKAKGWL